ncbi:antibiotic biosynthesis monooxygenase [Pantanalinema rosaneae CENA516]|uniref:antibiotic biosynthesis monooxygenase n=1 Tax=Pantanalinema rosaneae TaxID=1620701 RepID=UPI003D6DB08E
MPMPHPDQSSDPITLVISEVVKPDCLQEYEGWVKEVNQAARQFPGFRGVEVIRPRDRAHAEYVVIVKFNHYEQLKAWLTSEIYQQWVENVRHLFVSRSSQQLPDGLELWFTLPPNAEQPFPQPAYYKKVILGVLGVYPLILLADALLKPLVKDLPPLLALFLSVMLVSALLTYPVLPWLTQILNFWLYPPPHSPRQPHRKRNR